MALIDYRGYRLIAQSVRRRNVFGEIVIIILIFSVHLRFEFVDLLVASIVTLRDLYIGRLHSAPKVLPINSPDTLRYGSDDGGQSVRCRRLPPFDAASIRFAVVFIQKSTEKLCRFDRLVTVSQHLYSLFSLLSSTGAQRRRRTRNENAPRCAPLESQRFATISLCSVL